MTSYSRSRPETQSQARERGQSPWVWFAACRYVQEPLKNDSSIEMTRGVDAKEHERSCGCEREDPSTTIIDQVLTQQLSQGNESVDAPRRRTTAVKLERKEQEGDLECGDADEHGGVDLWPPGLCSSVATCRNAVKLWKRDK